MTRYALLPIHEAALDLTVQLARVVVAFSR
jgi:hypothetical protein